MQQESPPPNAPVPGSSSPLPDTHSDALTSHASDTRLSPDQTIRLDLLISEWSPSLWTHAPRVTEVATGRVLLDLWGTSWDAQTAWVGASGLRLDLRRYDRGGAFTVLLDFLRGTYRIGEPGARACPMGEVRHGIEETFERAHLRYLESLAVPDIVTAGLPDAVATPDDPVPSPPQDGQFFDRWYRRLMARFANAKSQ